MPADVGVPDGSPSAPAALRSHGRHEPGSLTLEITSVGTAYRLVVCVRLPGARVRSAPSATLRGGAVCATRPRLLEGEHLTLRIRYQARRCVAPRLTLQAANALPTSPSAREFACAA